MTKELKKIVVDLTPVLPGGENGGAKIFVLNLLSEMAKISKGTMFFLLIHENVYNELQAIENENIKFLKVNGNVQRIIPNIKSLVANYLIKLLKFFSLKGPLLLRTKALRFGYILFDRLKRSQLSVCLKKMDADLLFCPFTAPFYSEKEIPTVCVIYDLQHKSYPDFFSKKEIIQREITFSKACQKATMLSTISNYSRDSILRHSQVSPQKVRTIYIQMANRILRSNHEQDLSILNKKNLSPQGYLIYPANYWKHKNHEMLITAFRMACNKKVDSQIKLVFTGAHEARRDWLEQIIQKMNMENRIILLGYVSNEELSILIKESKGVVFPSLYEGFGLPVIEAMAAGIPVACSNAGALPEVVSNAALIFDPRVPLQIAEAMVTLIQDDEVRKDLIHKGKKRAEVFGDVNRMATEYLNLFKEAVALRNSASVMNFIE